MKKALLLDVSAMMYRAYYANMNMRTKEMPTGAVYGFLLTLFHLLKEYEPDYIGAAFDIKRSQLKRTELYPEYKSNRDSAPEDLIQQIPYIEKVLDAFDIQRIKMDGYEADDILGSLSKKLAEEGIQVTIVTGDKDIAQVLSENIEIYLLGKEALKTREDVKNYIDVYPEMIPDLFGLIGDSSDCIPGVRKIGPKKAVPMLEKYGNLEGIYEHIEELTELPGIGKSLVQLMKEDRDFAFLSRDLARIETNLVFDFESSDLVFQQKDEELKALLQKLEFKSFLRRFESQGESPKEERIEKKEEVAGVQTSLFGDMKAKTELSVPHQTFTRSILESESLFLEILGKISEEERVLLLLDRLGFALIRKGESYYIPLFHPALFNSNLELAFCMKELSKLKAKLYSYDLKSFYHLGFEQGKKVSDLMLMYHLVSSQTKEDYTLIAQSYLKTLAVDEKTYFGKKKIESLSSEEFAPFLFERAEALFVCIPSLELELKEKNLATVFEETEEPLIPVLYEMEKNGIKINAPYFEDYSKELELALGNVEQSIYAEAGETFNLNSPKQLGEILFLKLNLPAGKKTKTGFSTDVEVLENLSEQGFSIAKNLLDYRKLSKLKNTYVDPLPKMMKDGNRIHTTYHQIGTVTGRLSSSDPNLQNIPVKTDEGIRIRQGFVAREGWKLLSIDYSQVELRVLASLSKDENLLRAYQAEEDLHHLTAQKIFELGEEDEVSREQRTMAKIINFSIIYGKTAFGLAKELGISVKDAGDYIQRYFAQYPRVAQFEREIVAFAEEHGYVETYFGRRRNIEGIHSKNRMMKSQAERMAINTVVQGTAAEILKKAMLKIYEWLSGKEDVLLLLQVHDELIFEIREEKVEEYTQILKNFMQNTVKLEGVPLEANANVGDTWAETK